MNLAIITVPRPGTDFPERSLAHLRAADEATEAIHLFASDDDLVYLDTLAAMPRVVVHPLSFDAQQRIANWPLMRKHTCNYWRCLDHFAGLSEGLVLCEDDVLYDPQFFVRLREAITEAELIRRDYILALYSPWDHADSLESRGGRTLSSYRSDSFFGTQGMYYTAESLGEVTDLILRRGVERGEEPTDVLIAQWARGREPILTTTVSLGEPILTTTVSLVQHIGQISTGLGYWHSSPSFGRPWPTAAVAAGCVAELDEGKEVQS